METGSASAMTAPDSPLTSDTSSGVPPGWRKKLVPTKAKGATNKKYDVVYVAPDGQELQSKWHLQRYLKAHPDGPASSEFVWTSGEDTPVRRSARLTRPVARLSESVPRRHKRPISSLDRDIQDGNVQYQKSPRKRAKLPVSKSKSGKQSLMDAKPKIGTDRVNMTNVETHLDCLSEAKAEKESDAEDNIASMAVDSEARPSETHAKMSSSVGIELTIEGSTVSPDHRTFENPSDVNPVDDTVTSTTAEAVAMDASASTKPDESVNTLPPIKASTIGDKYEKSFPKSRLIPHHLEQTATSNVPKHESGSNLASEMDQKMDDSHPTVTDTPSASVHGIDAVDASENKVPNEPETKADIPVHEKPDLQIDVDTENRT